MLLAVQSCVSSGPPGPTGPLGPLEGEAPGPVAEGDGAPVPEVLEGRAAKPMRAPALPNLEEIEAHNVSHIPYRAWCSHCVRGRGKSFAHHRVDRPEDPEEVPVVSIDYGMVCLEPLASYLRMLSVGPRCLSWWFTTARAKLCFHTWCPQGRGALLS